MQVAGEFCRVLAIVRSYKVACREIDCLAGMCSMLLFSCGILFLQNLGDAGRSRLLPYLLSLLLFLDVWALHLRSGPARGEGGRTSHSLAAGSAAALLSSSRGHLACSLARG